MPARGIGHPCQMPVDPDRPGREFSRQSYAPLRPYVRSARLWVIPPNRGGRPKGLQVDFTPDARTERPLTGNSVGSIIQESGPHGTLLRQDTRFSADPDFVSQVWQLPIASETRQLTVADLKLMLERLDDDISVVLSLPETDGGQMRFTGGGFWNRPAKNDFEGDRTFLLFPDSNEWQLMTDELIEIDKEMNA